MSSSPLVVLVVRVSDVPTKPLGHTVARCTKCRAICWIDAQLIKDMPPGSVLAPACSVCVEQDRRIAIGDVAHAARRIASGQ